MFTFASDGSGASVRWVVWAGGVSVRGRTAVVERLLGAWVVGVALVWIAVWLAGVFGWSSVVAGGVRGRARLG